MTDASLLLTLFHKMGKDSSEEERTAIQNGCCPNCLPDRVPYRILETFYSEEFAMDVHRVKCFDIARCEWETLIPTRRSDNGLENFFAS
jgi:hypothetical protein